MMMSPLLPLKFPLKLRQSSRSALRDRNQNQSPRLSLRLSRRRPRHPRRVSLDHESPDAVAAAEVAADLVRVQRRWRPWSLRDLRRQKHPRRHLKRCQHVPFPLKPQPLTPPLPRAPARERLFWRLGSRGRARVPGSSGMIFIHFRAICCANFFSMTRRSSAFRTSCFRICDRC